MCGIVALISKKPPYFTYKHKKMFAEMLYIDTLRGEDSTGIFAVNKYGNVLWGKSADTAEKFLEEENLLKDMVWDYRAVVGHNRKATKGTIVDENAHPFVEDNIILVHNGTLTNHKELNSTVEVDSHAIAHVIKEKGIKKAISLLDGAFAVISYDVKKKQLSLFRNAERPLWLAENEDIIAIASEPWIIQGTAWRNEIKFEKVDEIPPAKLITLDFNETEVTEKNTAVKLIQKKNIVVPFMKKSHASSAAAQQDVDDFLDSFKKGDSIVFNPNRWTANNIGFTIEGTHHIFSEVRVVANCSHDRYNKDSMSRLLQTDRLVAEITGISYNSTSQAKTVFCNAPEESYSIVTANGYILGEDEVNQLSGECNRCKGVIEEEELESSYYRKNKNGRVIHICPECVAQSLANNPNWGGISAYEASNSTV